MKKQILLPTSVLRELRAVFGVGRNDVRRALNYERNSERAKLLRAAALSRGGLIYTCAVAPASYMPNVETHYDHVRGVIYQSITERVELQICRETNVATIFVNGEPLATFDDMTTGTWGNVLYSLQQIYNQLNQ